MSKLLHPDRKRVLQIQFERKADKFFDKRSIGEDEINELIIKAVKKLIGHDENIDLKQLKGELKGYFRIRKNDLRIIFIVIEDENIIIVTIVNIDFRGNVYK
jgi:mRNA-degrading endonuclease RelE of RelBE toxin-antitoxin system